MFDQEFFTDPAGFEQIVSEYIKREGVLSPVVELVLEDDTAFFACAIDAVGGSWISFQTYDERFDEEGEGCARVQTTVPLESIKMMNFYPSHPERSEQPLGFRLHRDVKLSK